MEELRYISIHEITPNPYQPRLQFDSKKLEELAQSIKKNGLIQPMIVRPSSIIGFELLAGERRLRACQLAGLEKVPVIVKVLSDEEMMTQSIIENLQRADLNPIEEANSYLKLLEQGITHEEIAKRMGKSRPYISNSLRLLHLPKEIQEELASGQLSAGHARILIPLKKDKQLYYVDLVKKLHLSVRQLEQRVKKTKSKTKQTKNIFSLSEEVWLQKYFGTAVQIKQDKNGKGKIVIPFENLDEFEQIIHSLK
ncbi:ParB/RepB/Spo0J family partition protein [Streptococcus sp. DD13]|uniref:ParB/RepB/Spo0J family partition protein n=1 Tax=Streptococcus sp. DD13 TaxID=1777881 RepID=UPI000794208C|nr:ParB/RepB/Spo0J family partition protein [Streptococcus sp. DD13]KXT77774.1 Chromosome (plasmid) partitioning protein ParB / Stage 0 sporulation protein J [Streptococcus sp. DD13]